jgi:hypothetical protein
MCESILFSSYVCIKLTVHFHRIWIGFSLSLFVCVCVCVCVCVYTLYDANLQESAWMKYNIAISFQILHYGDVLHNAWVEIALRQFSLMCSFELSVIHVYFVLTQPSVAFRIFS